MREMERIVIIGHLERICVFLQKKVDLALKIFLISVIPFLLRGGGDSEQNHLSGPNSCLLNIAREAILYLRLFAKMTLLYGKIFFIPEIK